MPRATVRQSILELLHAHHALSAPQLLEHLHTQGQQVNKTSVYRALDKLQADHMLCKYNLHDNEIVYELNDPHHDHLICENCGKIAVTECRGESPFMRDGFQVRHHHVTFYGLCSNCQT